MKHALLVITILVIVAATLSLPPIPQDPAYHQMADRRMLFGVRNAMDVLSNLPFLVFGILGMRTVIHGRPRGLTRDATWAWLGFFGATAATAVGSVYYHLSPSNDRVVLDRLPIAVACASLVAVLITERVNARIGRIVFALFTFLAAGSVGYWYQGELLGGGDLRPYAGVQFGSLVLVLAILVLYREPASETRLLVAGLIAYGVAKLCEVADAPIYELTTVISGHTLKHVAAAASVGCVVAMLKVRLGTIEGGSVGSAGLTRVIARPPAAS
jgi:hypothetical protein